MNKGEEIYRSQRSDFKTIASSAAQILMSFTEAAKGTQSIPALDLDPWHSNPIITKETSCYNLALNVIQGGRPPVFMNMLRPGDIKGYKDKGCDWQRILELEEEEDRALGPGFRKDPERFPQYITYRMNGALGDGVRWLGHEPKFVTPPKGNLVLCFFKQANEKLSNDVHWASVRTKPGSIPVIVTKAPRTKVRVHDDPQEIFTICETYRYNRFAGYFLWPDDLHV